MQALRKEPEWRYQSAADLRDDITRYLEGRPVSDLPDAPHATAVLRPDAVEENSLAVLPMKLLDINQPETSPDYLGTGLADALITRLSAIRSFAVRPTSSVLRYGGDADPLRAGRELAVAFVLDGRIRRAGDRIRVTIQLLDVRDETTAWAGQFDEQFTDVLSLEDAISSHVAEAIVPHLTVDQRLRLAKRGTDNPQAHEAYLRGRFYWNTFTEDGFARAIVCYQQAIALDPDYALAHAGVANYHNWLGVFSVMPFAECAAAAYEAASRAVEIDPNLAEGHTALGQAILMSRLCLGQRRASSACAPSNSIRIIRRPEPGMRCNSRWKAASAKHCARPTPDAISIRSPLSLASPLSGVRITRGVMTRLIDSQAPRSRTSRATR